MDDEFYRDSGPTAAGLSFFERVKAGLSTAIGAVVALGIILAMGVWFFRLGDRDPQSVPIIRADLGPTKKIPEDPGGERTPHQGIKSYEAAGGTVTAGAAVITAAPPEPKPEDVAMGKLTARAVAEAATTATEPAPAETETAAPDEPADGERLAAAPDVTTTAPVPPVRRAGAPVAEIPADDERSAIPDEELIIPGATEYAPDQSPGAPRRPRDLAARNETAAKTAARERSDLAAAAAQSPYQIQLIADPDRQLVLRLWERIYKANDDILQGRALAVQSTNSGGVTWYRLRVGPFKSRAEAASVCQALKARDQDCVVSKNS